MRPTGIVRLLGLVSVVASAAVKPDFATMSDPSYIEELLSADPDDTREAVENVLLNLQGLNPVRLDSHPADSDPAPAFNFNEAQWLEVEALTEAFIPEIQLSTAEVLMSDIPSDLQETFATKSPFNNPQFRINFRHALDAVDPANRNLLNLVVEVLTRRPLAFVITQSFKLLHEMSIEERQAVILRLRSSILIPYRQLYRSLLDMSMLGLYYSDERMLDAIEYYFNSKDALAFEQQPFWRAPIETSPASSNPQAPWEVDTDVVIIGSGSTGGVVAHRLAKEGVRVLVLEKGYQVGPSELSRDEYETERRTFELSNRLLTKDRSMNVLAGTTLGGGAAINWSNSLKVPREVREHWASVGVPWATTNLLDEAQDYVWDIMGTTLDYPGNHSFTNQLILDGSAKLGYPAGKTAQNTGQHIPNTGFLGFGSRFGEKGGVVNWLYEAVENGAKIIDHCEVTRIRQANGKATGVDALINGNRQLIVNAKRVVVCTGALQTPLLLRRSGFRNQHIGQGLKLHPVTAVYGDFDEIVNKPDDLIMTTANSRDADLDGEFHGARIEAFHHLLSLTFKFLPWSAGDLYRELCARYKHLSMLLVIARDRGAGRVVYNPRDPMDLTIDYETSEFDFYALQRGSVTAANLLYVQGAKRIIWPHPDVPIFETDVPVDQRDVNDVYFQYWLAQATQIPFERYYVGLGSAHQMASCRMSNQGPRAAAVDERGRLYECPNVHVTDTSVFPSASGVNPMISCMTVAHVLAGFLLEELSSS